jgi:hypothetical protein
MRKIRVGWVNDAYGSGGGTADEEAADDIKRLESTLEYKLESVVIGRHMSDVADKDIDLLAFDYGGAAHSYSNTPLIELKAMIKWAEEHPGRLVILYSQMTGRMYSRYVKSEFFVGSVPSNIRYWHLPDIHASWDDDTRERENIAAWFAGGEFERSAWYE